MTVHAEEPSYWS